MGDARAAEAVASLCRVAVATDGEIAALEARWAAAAAEAAAEAESSPRSASPSSSSRTPPLPLPAPEDLARAPLSAANEARAAMHMLEVTRGALYGYPTTADDDRALLRQTTDFFSRRRNAVLARLGEKVVLEHFAQLAERSLDYLSEYNDHMDALDAERAERAGQVGRPPEPPDDDDDERGPSEETVARAPRVVPRGYVERLAAQHASSLLLTADSPSTPDSL